MGRQWRLSRDGPGRGRRPSPQSARPVVEGVVERLVPVRCTPHRGLFRTARNFEAVTRQKEALVPLGPLAAGLAHEINSPAAAATRAVDALGDACEVLLSSLARL